MITGVSAVVAGGLHIHVFAVRRDIMYYLVSIGYLALVFFDGHVSLIEAVLGLRRVTSFIWVCSSCLKDPEVDDEPQPFGH